MQDIATALHLSGFSEAQATDTEGQTSLGISISTCGSHIWLMYLLLESCSALSIKGRFTTLKMTNIARDSTS